jgi:nucleoside-diphosphate-sugar epimerase
MIGVTGANGLLGSFIVRKLLDLDEPFIAFKRNGSDVSLLSDVNGRIQWRDVDLLDPVSTEDALQGVTSIIHSAARVSFNPRLAREITAVNVQGTRNLIDAALANGIDRFIFISSVGALGRMKGQAVLDETNKWVDNAQHTVYATSKYLAELEVFRGQEEGLQTLTLNPSVILAPADWTKSSARLFKYVWDERLFYIDGSLNYVDVRDVATAACMALKSGIENERFIVSAGSVSVREFFEAVAHRFGKRPPMVKLNKNLVKIVAGFETLRARLHRSEPLITAETARLADTRFQYQNDKIKNAFQLQFHPLEETIDWCCQYYIRKFGGKPG